jgi:hypothetical protein
VPATLFEASSSTAGRFPSLEVSALAEHFSTSRIPVSSLASATSEMEPEGRGMSFLLNGVSVDLEY